MQIAIRRFTTLVENRFIEARRPAKVPLRSVAIVAVVENPYTDRYVPDLSALVDASRAIGEQMAGEAMTALGGMPAQSYGKAGLVGIRGEQEHANAFLTTVFADPFRHAIGGASAWISSVTKIAAPGASVDIPLNCIDDIYVRSHYGTMTFALGETPMPDEIALIFCLTTGGRLNARVGGKPYESTRDASTSRS